HSAPEMIKQANNMLRKRSSCTTRHQAQILRGALYCLGNQQEARRVKGNIIAPRYMGRSKKGRSASGRRRASVILYECQKPGTATVKIFRRPEWPRRGQISVAHVRSGEAGTR